MRGNTMTSATTATRPEHQWATFDPAALSDGTALRPCARGDWCAGRDSYGTPAYGPRTFCEPDRGHIQTVLGPARGGLPHLYRELGARIGDKSGVADGPRVSGGAASPPIPLNAGVDALMQEIGSIFHGWYERVCTLARLVQPDTGNWIRIDPGTFEGMCRTLTSHVDVLLGLEDGPMRRTAERYDLVPDGAYSVMEISGDWFSYLLDRSGAEAGLEVFAFHQRLRRRLGYTPKHQRLRSRCTQPGCGGIGKLLQRDGQTGLNDVTCEGCGHQYIGDELAELLAAEEHLKNAPAARRQAS